MAVYVTRFGPSAPERCLDPRISVEPRLGDLAIANVEYVDNAIGESAPDAFGPRHLERDRMPIIGEDVVQLDMERAAGGLAHPMHEIADRL